MRHIIHQQDKLNRWRHPLICLATAFVVYVMATGDACGQLSGAVDASAVVAQQDSTDATAGSDSTDQPASEVPDFATIVRKIKSNDREVNRLYSSMPIGFPAKQVEYKEKIKGLDAETERLTVMLDQAALESFKKAPGENPAAVQRLMSNLTGLLDAKGSGSHFDPSGALEIADVLLGGGGDKSPIVLFQAFRAKYAMEDFPGARQMLERIEELGTKLSSQMAAVDATSENWRRELMIRRLEKNNDDLPRVKFETDEGEFTVELFEDHAPNTVANFVSLVEKNFYNGLIFHDVKPGEYSATGCPNGDGSGGPGYNIATEADREQPRHFFAGTLGMLNTGENVTGSQFFITHQPDSQLNQRFTAFGRVVEGFDTVRNMQRYNAEELQPQFGGSSPGEVKPARIDKATVVRKRGHEYQPEKVARTASPDMFGIPGMSEGLPNSDGENPDAIPAMDSSSTTSSAIDDIAPVNSGVFIPAP